MARKVKYRKPVRETRKKIADLFREAHKEAKLGFCRRASGLYNEAVGIANRKDIGTTNETFMRMKRILFRCRQENGFGR